MSGGNAAEYNGMSNPLGPVVAALRQLGLSDDLIARMMTGGVSPEGIRAAMNEHEAVVLLAAIGSGNNPIARAINGGVEGAVTISMEHFPEQTIAALNLLEQIDGAVGVTVEFVDNATGNVVSRAWNTLTPTEQNAILGGTVIASVAIPELSLSRLQALKITPGTASSNTPLGLGSTGRTLPQNLAEQLAMQQAISNPAAGIILPLRSGMTDSRWPASDGWVKMSQNVNGIEIHYVRNTLTGEIDGFKFK